jgi:hypothetical protein
MSKKPLFQEICHLQHVYNQMRFSGNSCKNDLFGHPLKGMYYLFLYNAIVINWLMNMQPFVIDLHPFWNRF